MRKFFVFTITWGVGGSLNLKQRSDFSNKLSDMAKGKVDMPSDLIKTPGYSLIDYCVKIEDQEWHNYQENVDEEEIDSK
jgi:hypothetical protein